MDDLKQSIQTVFKGAFQAVATFPSASISAFLFMLTTMVRIQVDGMQAEKYQLLFNSIHWSLGLCALFGLLLVTYLRGAGKSEKLIGGAQWLTPVLFFLTFSSLYFFGKVQPSPDSYRTYPYLSALTNARMGILYGILFIAFLLVAARPKKQPKMARAVFMIQKGLVVTGIYGLVLFAGTSAVAGAIQGLLYPAMSFKVYQYLGAMVGWLTFLLFLGYLPDFTKDEKDAKRQEAESQSKFTHFLFSYLFVPITLALTVVLLLWAIKILFQGVGDNFLTLSSISTSYVVIGIWLHLMVQEADNKLARFYCQVYPWATLLILVFEGWALVTQLRVYGMQTTEYYFVLVWVVALLAVILLLWQKDQGYPKIFLLLMAAMLFTVLPLVGYQSLPIRLQTQRLENLLIEANMWESNKIIPGSETLDRPLREKITLSAQFLARQEAEKVPTWLTISAYDSQSFEQVMGFAPIRPRQDSQPPVKDETQSMDLRRSEQALNIQPYTWRLTLRYEEKQKGQVASFTGHEGDYVISWLENQEENQVPQIKITLNEQEIVSESLAPYLEQLLAEHPLQPLSEQTEAVQLDDLAFPFSSDYFDGIFVFNGIEVRLDPKKQEKTYWFDIEGIYVNEKESDD
ncbi:hypothetical protein ACYSNO_10105 [Enterococcus sp. LJL98]